MLATTRDQLKQDSFAGFFLTRTHALKQLTTRYGHPRAQVVVAGVKSLDYSSAVFSSKPATAIVAVFVFASTEARFWGYLDTAKLCYYTDKALLESLQDNYWHPLCRTDFSADGSLHYVVSKRDCIDAIPLCVSFGTLPLSVHASFNAYNPPALPGVDVQRNRFESAVANRFLMYCDVWQSDMLDPVLFTLSSKMACLYDTAAYKLVLAAVTDREFQRMQDFKSVRSRWLELETTISRQRLAFCNDLTRFLPPNSSVLARSDVRVPELVKRAWPHEQEFLKVPFEHACAALRRRDVLLVRGDAYLRKQKYLIEVVCEYMRRVHDTNFIEAWGSESISDRSMQPLLRYIRRRFQQLMIGSTTQLQQQLQQQKTVSIQQMQQHGPPCIRTLLGLALDTKNPDHLKYEQRQQLASFLFHFGYTMHEVLQLWSVKMKQVYKGGVVPRDIVTSLKWRWEYTQRVRSNSSANSVGTTCWLMSNKCAVCPYAKQTNNLHMQRTACTTASSLPKPFQDPQQALQVVIDAVRHQ